VYIDTLHRVLGDVTIQFDQLLTQDLPGLNDSLKSKGQQPIEVSPAKVGSNDAAHEPGGVAGAGAHFPTDFQISW
jgi:hypothetical protein